MSPGRVSAWLVAALLCACDSRTSLPGPDILSVAPNQVTVPRDVPVEERSPVRVALDAVIPVRVDYGQEQVSTDAARVWIGAEAAPVQSLDRDGTLIITVPESLDLGTYDVRVALSDGREAVRPSVLSLIPKARSWPVDEDAGPGEEPVELDAGPLMSSDAGPELDAGTPATDAGSNLPDGPGPNDPILPGDITGFTIEAVGDQARGSPFRVIVHALGPRAAHFQDSVELTINKNNGTVSPLKLGPFDNGLVEQSVTVTAHGANIKLTVTDAYGAQGTSNGFKVQ